MMLVKGTISDNMSVIRLSQILLFVIAATHCGCHSPKKLKLASSIEGAASTEVGKELAGYLNSNGWQMETFPYEGTAGIHQLEPLLQRRCDLSFLPERQYCRPSNRRFAHGTSILSKCQLYLLPEQHKSPEPQRSFEESQSSVK
jgi:hypothetical protein